MECALLVVGNEILDGTVKEENASWLAGRLNALGFRVKRIGVVGDSEEEIEEGLEWVLKGSRFVFVCGGLGGTPDDRTREAVARKLGRKLVQHEGARRELEEKLERLRKRGLTLGGEEWIMRMSLVPEGGEILRNRLGLAPGIRLSHEGVEVFLLPGVPVELKVIFAEEVEPLLGRGEEREVAELTLGSEETRFSGLAEELEREYGVVVGMYPLFGRLEVRMRIVGKVGKVAEAAKRVREEAERAGVPLLAERSFRLG
ncbi:MAG: competence/damage-inducible protein A [Candidatus Hadarchaeales archaeon]